MLGDSARQKQHEYLYWEYARKKQAVRMGDWKAVLLNPNMEIELYNLKNDIGEKHNLSNQYPGIVAKMKQIMKEGRTESEFFPLIKN